MLETRQGNYYAYKCGKCVYYLWIGFTVKRFKSSFSLRDCFWVMKVTKNSENVTVEAKYSVNINEPSKKLSWVYTTMQPTIFVY